MFGVFVVAFIIILLVGTSWIFLFNNPNGASNIDVQELYNNYHKYLGKVVTVRGYFRFYSGAYAIATGTISPNDPVFLEIPSSVNTTILVQDKEYYFTGIPNYGVFTSFNSHFQNGAQYRDSLYITITKIQPT